MSVVEQIEEKLTDPQKHAPILKALVAILEEHGEKGVRDRIKQWIEEIEAEVPPSTEREE